MTYLQKERQRWNTFDVWMKSVVKITPHIVCSNPYVWTANNILRAYVQTAWNGMEFNYYSILSAGMSSLLLFCARCFWMSHSIFYLYWDIVFITCVHQHQQQCQRNECNAFNMSIKILIFLLLLHMRIPKVRYLFGIIWIFFGCLFIWTNEMTRKGRIENNNKQIIGTQSERKRRKQIHAHTGRSSNGVSDKKLYRNRLRITTLSCRA